tara:strand:+ start:486 stop:842 length:357 start_codon:yes stop_codon:yes gene_type:complete
MITITFNPQTPEQIKILAWAMTKLLESTATEPAIEEEAPAKKPKVAKAARPPVNEILAEPETPVAASAVTLEEVRAKLVAYKEKGKSLKELFESVGCANLSAVPPERYSELLANIAKS